MDELQLQSHEKIEKKIDFSLTLPFYNEEPNIKPVLEDIIAVLVEAGLSFELVAVDNGSRDRTGEIIQAMHEADPRVRPLTLPVNQGYGRGILAGLGHARGEVLGYAWGDGQVSARDLLRIYQAWKQEKADIAKASRITRCDGIFRLIQTRIYALIFALLFGKGFKDPNGCPKVFSREVFERIAPRSQGWLLDPEIMIKARRLKMKIIQVPVEFLKREHGESKVRVFTAFGFFAGLLRLRFLPGPRDRQ